MQSLLMRLWKVLMNTQNNNYPKILLPKKNYKMIDIENLVDLRLFLVRRALKLKSEDVFDEFGFLLDGAIVEESLKDIAGMSMNLLGGHFLVEHIRFIPKKAAMKDWEEGNDVAWEDIKSNIESIENSIPIFFELFSIHKQVYPYFKANKNLPKGIAVDSNSKHTKFQGSTCITHKPTLANFWHIEFQILAEDESFDNQLVDRSKIKSFDYDRNPDEQPYRTQCAYFAYQHCIKVKAHQNIEEFDNIPILFYKKPNINVYDRLKLAVKELFKRYKISYLH